MTTPLTGFQARCRKIILCEIHQDFRRRDGVLHRTAFSTHADMRVVLQHLPGDVARSSADILKRTSYWSGGAKAPITGSRMLTPDQISELHRLHFVEKWPARKISRQMRIGRRTIAKYLNTPAAKAAHRDRASKLDPFKPIIADLL